MLECPSVKLTDPRPYQRRSRAGFRSAAFFSAIGGGLIRRSLVICGAMTASENLLPALWDCGYSVAELWGFTAPVSRGTSLISEPHGLLWGILGIVEYQVDKGAGHRYLQQRISSGDWIGIGFDEKTAEEKQLLIVPKIKDAKFGRRKSAVGDGVTNYISVRFVHQRLLEDQIGAAESGGLSAG
jgi:hypothetical protein